MLLLSVNENRPRAMKEKGNHKELLYILISVILRLMLFFLLIVPLSSVCMCNYVHAHLVIRLCIEIHILCRTV